ncbi:phospholipid scramblase 1-like [Ornithodoros turicata]|uniref:phospholipid scramblase 1-like n=1 Tax=Ornithodoros turicata TaxID=34597 RepID=UPI00313A47FE
MKGPQPEPMSPTGPSPVANAVTVRPPGLVPRPGGPATAGLSVVPVCQPLAPPSMCPPGLEYLAIIDQLIISQQIQLVEVLTGFEQKNKYVIKNSMGQFVYFAGEETDFCTRIIFGGIRPFEIRIYDIRGAEVIRCFRPLRCDSCCFFCCLQEMEVQAPPGVPVGYIQQDWSVIFPMFTLMNARREPSLKIKGPFITSSCLGDVKFEVWTVDWRHKIGLLSKNWSGALREMFTSADNFSISVPIDLDVRMKATLIGCTLLIDFIFFEGSRSPDLPGNLFN